MRNISTHLLQCYSRVKRTLLLNASDISSVMASNKQHYSAKYARLDPCDLEQSTNKLQKENYLNVLLLESHCATRMGSLTRRWSCDPDGVVAAPQHFAQMVLLICPFFLYIARVARAIAVRIGFRIVFYVI